MRCTIVVILVLIGLEILPAPVILALLIMLIYVAVRRRTKRPTVVGSSVKDLERWDKTFEKSLLKHNDYARARDAADRTMK